jgi:hypothetical protein
MQESLPPIESRTRLVAKVSAVYLVYAALCAVFAWYTLYHHLAIGWVIGGVALICLLGIMFWFWSMRAYVQRHRAQTRAFYSKLGTEISQARTKAADAKTAPGHAPSETVTVSIGMYTVRQTVGLTLMSMYRTPRNALVLVILSLVIAFCLLLNNWPLSIPRLILALALAIAFNGLLVATASTATRRALKKLWQGKKEAVVTISSRGLEISQGTSSPILPWTSIDRVRETRSWILFMRNKRRVITLPISRVPQQSLGRLREILRTAKGQLADLQSR